MITAVIPDEVEGENVHSDGWNPSPEQFERYRTREVELCRANIQRAQASAGGPDRVAVGMAHLHSWATALEAVTGLHVESKTEIVRARC